MKKMLLVLIVILQFVGCKSDKDKYTIDFSTKPKMDFSTPDKSVESYLNYLVWEDTCLTNLHKEYYRNAKDFRNISFYKPIRDSLINKQYKSFAEMKDRAKKRAKIEKVDIESDTRAIVLINTGEFTYTDKAPVLDKYTLTKENNEWLIKTIEKTCYVCESTGKVVDYSNYSLYSKSYIACESCKGDGWTDVVNDDF